MKLCFNINYGKSTQAFKINLQPRSNYPKDIVRQNNPIRPGGLEYSAFISYINNVWKNMQNKVHDKTIFFIIEKVIKENFL